MQYLVELSEHPLTHSRYRRVKCDRAKPVCGRCQKDDKQCHGEGYSHRLIIKDETQQTIHRISGKQALEESLNASSLPASSDNELMSPILAQMPATQNDETVDAQVRSPTEFIWAYNTDWVPVANQRLYKKVEEFQLAVYCCKEAITLGTLGWVMTEWNWLHTIAGTMQLSKALACAIRSNAVNWVAKASGAQTAPHQAIIEYTSALKHLQCDLYDSVKQRSWETLFVVLLLGIIDVLPPTIAT